MPGPQQETEGSLIYKLAKRVAEQTATDEHRRAVNAQVLFANQIYFAIFRMVADQNGLAAEALLRTLFESAVNCVILAKHKEKLNDFIRYGQFTHLRLLRFNDVMKEVTDALVKATEAEWEKLFAEFKAAEWHKLGTRDSFIEAELEPEMYDKYFRRASAIAHGEPYVTVHRTDATWKNWTVSARPDHWKTLTIGAYVLACYMMLRSLAVVSREFKLGLEEEIKQLLAQVDELKGKHIEAIKKAVAQPKDVSPGANKTPTP